MTKQKQQTRRIEVEFETMIKNMPRAVLGGLIKEYIAENNHVSWDGFSTRNLTGIRMFMRDLMTYYENNCNADTLGIEINNVNPVA